MSALLQGVPTFVAGAVFFSETKSDAPHHYANGIPYDADGAVATEAGPVVRYHQGLPFTANSRLARESGPVARVGAGAAPFTAAGALAISTAALIEHFSSGIGYSGGSQVAMTTEVAPPPLGPELLVDPEFDVPAEWAAIAGWTVTGGEMVAVAAASFGPHALNGVTIIGATYEVSFTISEYTEGDIKVRCGNADSAFFLTAGTHTVELVALVVGPVLQLIAGASFTGKISSASVKQVL
jgi:hypothetical protein